MNQDCILVLLSMIKKDPKDILVAEQGEAERPYCALLHAEGTHDFVQPHVMANRASFIVFMTHVGI